MDEGGTLYLLPNTIWPGTQALFITEVHREVVRNAKAICAENPARAAAFLKSVAPDWNPSHCTWYDLRVEDARGFQEFLTEVERKGTGILLSDSGLPCIADPGAAVVRMAHQRKIHVHPLPGPSSLMLALAASGLNGQKFRFHGYPPREMPALQQHINQLNQWLLENPKETHIYIEAPQRNATLFKAFVNHLSPSLMLCIASGLMGPEEYVATRSTAQWKKEGPPPLAKNPCVFLAGS
ncbi:MAG: SAM-dependent methyltransferase [Flavobacteriales bacterium]|nr:SAM-dependent methyltransferase [Flavobacteriales bacterium]MCX7768694.1 SAM-dependent methyltransferase [Flavobacteriales bacterium]MDW8410107.1 SAM-dependent methyltransferase [Flavobacteriales bacterium]